MFKEIINSFCTDAGNLDSLYSDAKKLILKLNTYKKEDEEGKLEKLRNSTNPETISSSEVQSYYNDRKREFRHNQEQTKNNSIRLLPFKLIIVNFILNKHKSLTSVFFYEHFKEEYYIKMTKQLRIPAHTNPNQKIQYFEYLTKERANSLSKQFSLPIAFEEKENFRLIEVVVSNSFVVLIKIMRSFSNPLGKITVVGINEYTDFLKGIVYTKNKIINKSKFKLMRKLERVIEDRLQVYMRYPSLYVYVFNHLSKFTDLFKKSCGYCKLRSKFNCEENSIYPPFMISIDLENSDLYHDSCYPYICKIMK